MCSYNLACGGNVGELKICEVSTGFLSLPEVRNYLREREFVWVAQDASYSGLDSRVGPLTMADNIILAEKGLPAIFNISSHFRNMVRTTNLVVNALVVGTMICQEIAREFKIEDEIYTEYMRIVAGEYLYIDNAIFGTDETGKKHGGRAHYYFRGMDTKSIESFRISTR